MKKHEKRLSNLELACGALGMLCPVPIVGEALLTGFLYPIVKKIPIFKEGVSGIIASGAIATLTRLHFYENFYNPMMNYTEKFF